MDWCSRQGLAGAGPGRAVHGGRYGTYAEWCGVVAQRRTRAAPRPLFLDTLLEVRGDAVAGISKQQRKTLGETTPVAWAVASYIACCRARRVL